MILFDIVNLFLSIFLIFISIYGLTIVNFFDLIGNLSLIESMSLFFYGSLKGYSGTLKWFTTKMLFNLDKKKWTPETMRGAEKDAIIFISAGVLLFIQMIIIAIV